jgi:hypothetical protein
MLQNTAGALTSPPRRRCDLAASRLGGAVLEAIREFDALERPAFLEKYGFGESLTYYVRHNGSLYDSKALAGAAYAFQHPDEPRPGPDEDDGFGWPRSDGLKWPHFGLVDVLGSVWRMGGVEVVRSRCP